MNALLSSAAFEVSTGGIIMPHRAVCTPDSGFKAGGKIARGTLTNIKKEVSDPEQLLQMLIAAIREMGATMIENSEVTSKGNTECMSAGVILSESSAFVHLFRKTRTAAAIIFTCGDLVDPQDGVAILDRDLEAEPTFVIFHEVGKQGATPEEYIIQ